MDLYLTVRILDYQDYEKLLMQAKQQHTTPDQIIFKALRLYFSFYSKKDIDVSDTDML